MDLEDLNRSIARLGRAHDDLRSDEPLDSDPIRQFARWLEEAVRHEVAMPNTMCLATATAGGRPSARIVLLKGFDERGFVFFTNYESRKSNEMSENPRAALVFYWGELGRQVRITGMVERVDDRETQEYWATRPEGSRLGAWASPQSREVAGRDELEASFRAAGSRWAGTEIPVPPFWGGWRVGPEELEFWTARSDRLHDRWVYRRSGEGWDRLRLAP